MHTDMRPFKYRIHDASIGRFLSLDPLAPDYPHNSPYAFSENRVLDGVELEGLEVALIKDFDKISFKKPKLSNAFVVKNTKQLTVGHKFNGAWTNVSIAANSMSEKGSWYEHFGTKAYYSSELMKMEQFVRGTGSKKPITPHFIAKTNFKNNDYLNTYRHVLGQSIATIMYGREFAKLAGDAHEMHTIGWNIPYPLNSEKDTYADMINNQYARNLGEKLNGSLSIKGRWSSEQTATFMNEFNEYFNSSIPDLNNKLKTDYSSDDVFINDFTNSINESFYGEKQEQRKYK